MQLNFYWQGTPFFVSSVYDKKKLMLFWFWEERKEMFQNGDKTCSRVGIYVKLATLG
jgi:hypothetical protein